MRISSFIISNYKSFRDPQKLEFAPGFNVLVGQNNVGKTALLEALTLNFVGKPHKSLLSIPRVTAPYDQSSVVDVTVVLSGEELRDILLNIPEFYLPVPSRLSAPDAEDGVQLLEKILTYETIGFTLRLVAGEGRNPPDWIVSKFPSHALYDGQHPSGRQDRGRLFRCNPSPDKKGFTCTGPTEGDIQSELGVAIANILRSRVYHFRAERFNLATFQVGTQKILAPNAANLPEVLSVLQGNNPARFNHLNELLAQIFPSIYQISVINRPNGVVEIVVWTENANTQREDLAIPLSDSGTGVGQALAILYVVMTSEFPRTILIDEPNSFLHPAAARKLVEILRAKFPQHQYVVSTHSPEIIRTAQPSTLSLIKWENRQSVIESLDAERIEAIQGCLVEVGARLSDVFGADQILWVEGQTEEVCCRLILDQLATNVPPGVVIVAVRNTGDFESKRPSASAIWDIYSKLSTSNALIPPAIAFVFDREGRTMQEMKDLSRKSRQKVRFLPRRTYENYLICPDALQAVMSGLPSFAGNPVSKQQITEWLQRNGGKRVYISSPTLRTNIHDNAWLEKVHGAKLLADLFAEFSANREEYRKTIHSVQLTDWLVKNKPEMLTELRDFLSGLLN